MIFLILSRLLYFISYCFLSSLFTFVSDRLLWFFSEKCYYNYFIGHNLTSVCQIFFLRNKTGSIFLMFITMWSVSFLLLSVVIQTGTLFGLIEKQWLSLIKKKTWFRVEYTVEYRLLHYTVIQFKRWSFSCLACSDAHYPQWFTIFSTLKPSSMSAKSKISSVWTDLWTKQVVICIYGIADNNLKPNVF